MTGPFDAVARAAEYDAWIESMGLRELEVRDIGRIGWLAWQECSRRECDGRQKGSLEKENAALRKEVNAMRAKLGLGRKYVEWKEKP